MSAIEDRMNKEIRTVSGIEESVKHHEQGAALKLQAELRDIPKKYRHQVSSERADPGFGKVIVDPDFPTEYKPSSANIWVEKDKSGWHVKGDPSTRYDERTGEFADKNERWGPPKFIYKNKADQVMAERQPPDGHNGNYWTIR